MVHLRQERVRDPAAVTVALLSRREVVKGAAEQGGLGPTAQTPTPAALPTL